MTLAERARTAVAARLQGSSPPRGFRSSWPGYLVDWRDNLVSGIAAGDVEQDLRSGSGGELVDKPREPAKFCAAHSSSALAVNTFAPFRRHPDRLGLFGGGFRACRFEHKCPNGLQGTNPNLDFWAESDHAVLGVESKFLEPLEPKVVKFSEQYRRPFLGDDGSRIAEAPWSEAFKALRDGSLHFRHLDAAQLVKHYLGLIHSHADRARTLLYVYWEPLNAGHIAEFVAHRQEVTAFTFAVSGCETKFAAMSYPELWRDIEALQSWAGAADHLAAVRARYTFAL